MILEPRLSYLPIEYPEIFHAYRVAQKRGWSATEVDMSKDVNDWHNKLTESEKNIISGILRGFTITETLVGDYWSTIVAARFVKPEIVSVARYYSAEEACHADAYNHLAATLSINDHDQFLADPVAQARFSYLVGLPYRDNDIFSLAVSLAIFSGFVEGVSLFSAFSILYSFGSRGLLKSVNEIIEWSIRDEDSHSDTGIQLFRILLEECPELKNENLSTAIREGVLAIVANEEAFINSVFNDYTLPNLIKEEVVAYIRQRANQKWLALGVDSTELGLNYDSKLADNVIGNFEMTYQAPSDVDFFVSKSADYPTLTTQTFNYSNL